MESHPLLRGIFRHVAGITPEEGQETREFTAEAAGFSSKDEADELPGTCPELAKGQETRDFVAKHSGFESDREARRIREVVVHGTPELVKAMDDGELPVSTAAKLASLPKEAQRRVLAHGKEAVREAAAPSVDQVTRWWS